MADDCNGDPVDLGHRGLRIGAIFVIMASSAVGAFLPVLLARQSKMHVPKLTFFLCKFFGTGVIIATAWMHLLAPAADQLGDPCLEPRLGDYDWAFCIGLMTVIVMFTIELVVSHYSHDLGHDHDHGDSDHLAAKSLDDPSDVAGSTTSHPATTDTRKPSNTTTVQAADVERAIPLKSNSLIPGAQDDISYPPGGEEHLAHRHEHTEGDTFGGLAGQMTSIFILEFGILFHSVFIGLTLGTTEDLVILLIVLVFHQMFEGLGLGSRLAIAPWPKDRRWIPYLFALAFCLSTPMGIAIGIGVKPKNRNDQKLTNGIFDSISAGILMYTGLVELLAHEFMFNPSMRKSPLKIQLLAVGCVCLGVALMALLAKWA